MQVSRSTFRVESWRKKLLLTSLRCENQDLSDQKVGYCFIYGLKWQTQGCLLRTEWGILEKNCWCWNQTHPSLQSSFRSSTTQTHGHSWYLPFTSEVGTGSDITSELTTFQLRRQKTWTLSGKPLLLLLWVVSEQICSSPKEDLRWGEDIFVFQHCDYI